MNETTEKLGEKTSRGSNNLPIRLNLWQRIKIMLGCRMVFHVSIEQQGNQVNIFTGYRILPLGTKLEENKN